MNERYANKRLRLRGSGGRFRRATGADVGLRGVCSCGGLRTRVYVGDPNAAFVDPMAFRDRCARCGRDA